MENKSEILFEEKQYLGYNKYSNLRRMALGVFCFMAYYWSEEQGRGVELLFVMGIGIMIICLAALQIGPGRVRKPFRKDRK